MKKSHGAYRMFMARFRDAIFIVNEDDLEAVKAGLRNKGRLVTRVGD